MKSEFFQKLSVMIQKHIHKTQTYRTKQGKPTLYGKY